MGRPSRARRIFRPGTDRSPRSTTDALVQALPQEIVFSNADALVYLNKFYWELVDLVCGLAGLGLVAGAVLIPNAVSLNIVERRRELGILKAVSFTSGKVLQAILLENGVIGLIAGVLGMAAVVITVPVFNNPLPALRLSVHPEPAATMIGAAVLFALLSSLLVAGQPSRVRPMDVLRNE